MTQQQAALITMTERAASKMASLLSERGEPAEVRVFVEGSGGCSGYRYGLAPAKGKQADDIAIAQGELTLLVDPGSVELLRGAAIDFIEGEMGSGFTIDTPNAPSGGCGCGGHGGHGGESDGCGCGGHGGHGPEAERCC